MRSNKSRPAGDPAVTQAESPARRKRRTADDILGRIVTAATEEFARAGFAGATTAAIARKAEVTEAQLFRYFSSKSELFAETVFKPLDQHFLHFLHDHLPKPGDPLDHPKQVRLYTSELQAFIRSNAGLLTSLVVAQTYDADAAHGVAHINSLTTYFDRSAALMAARLKEPLQTDPRLLVRLAFASVLAVEMFRDWIFPPGLATGDQIEAAVTGFILRGTNEAP
jgi:AcrR family transcriptional regulator